MSVDQVFKLVAIIAYFAAMIGIGLWANRRTNDMDDYMLGGRTLSPAVAALSAGASDMSGWLLMGLPGGLYVTGLADAWIAIGLTIGAWLNWKIVAPRLRTYTEVAGNSITIPSYLENRLHDTSRALRIVSGLVILIFFTFYVSSGMVSGGVFFESSFGSSYRLGMLVVAGVTVLYTFFGGFIGASYTDMMQGLLIMSALVLVPVLAVVEVGPGNLVDAVTMTNPHAFSLVAGTTVIGVVSALAWGLGYFGQPHIIVRFMAMRSSADATRARRVGITWMVASLTGAVVTGLAGLAYFNQHPDLTLEDPETVFLSMSSILLHPLIAGLVLAAVLAAIMSTISSQLIVCSSALVHDLARVFFNRTLSPRNQVWFGRMGVLVVALVAAALAWTQNDTILALVAFAWAGFGACFGPIVLLSLFWRRLTTVGTLAGLVVSAVVVFTWQYTPWAELYEIVPGFIVNLLVTTGVSLATKTPDVTKEFDEMEALTH